LHGSARNEIAEIVAVIVVLELIDRFKFASMGTCPKPDIHTPIQKAIWFFDAALYAFSALGFLIYGGRFVSKYLDFEYPGC
jgi:hypothetical protein